MTETQAHIRTIYRYPVKGLSPQPLDRAELTAGQTLACDRLYAVENGPSGFDPAEPGYLPKTRFLMLMRNEQLGSTTATVLLVLAVSVVIAAGWLARRVGRSA